MERYWSGKKGDMTKHISNIFNKTVKYECKTNRGKLGIPACGKQRKSAVVAVGI